MVTTTLSAVMRLRVTVCYAATLVAVATTLLMLGPRVHDHVIRHMSTNLHNLAHGHFGTLIGSAFVTENGPMWVWLPGLVCLLAVAELLWRSTRVLVTITLGHVGATLIVAAGLAAALHLGWLPLSITRATDVGVSYSAAALLGALTAAMPSQWRPAWVGWWLAVGVLAVGISDDFTNAGHFVALVIGVVVSRRFGGRARWTKIRVALLVVSAAFGYLVLVNTGLSLIVAPIAGIAGAVGAHWLTRRWGRRRGRLARAAALL